MLPNIAFVGAGPTTIYTLKALVDHATLPFSLTIFEEQPCIGRGTPYRPGWNDPAMLSNIASIEIPALEQTLVEWLAAQGDGRLADLGIRPSEIDERTFYPRVALGEYFYDQLQALLDRARAQGIVVTVRTRCKVLDAVVMPDGMTLTVLPHRGEQFEEQFDHVVLATGHQWPAEPEVKPGYFLSPWPATALATIPPAKIGIRGSSLSAIDAAVALAVTHGAFVDTEEGDIRYVPAPSADAFRMTMMSRKGLLPEADFYFPIPYEPLDICNVEAIEALAASDEPDTLNRSFDLFRRELADADPDYAAKVGLDALTLESFYDSYFAERIAADPFDWAKRNLAEAQANYEATVTVRWRYAILRMHQAIERLVPYLEQDDFRRFSKYWKPVFVDDYATVPHESILRMLALRRAGKLDVLALGEDYQVVSHGLGNGAVLYLKGEPIHFPVFIEATGQRALPAKEFPFPSLLDQGIVRDAAPEEKGPTRGIIINDQFHPVSDGIPADQLFCLSLPFIMGKHPFVQGITSSHEMGLVVGPQLADAIARHGQAGNDDTAEGAAA